MYPSKKIRGLLFATLVCAVIGCRQDIATEAMTTGSAARPASAVPPSDAEAAAARRLDSTGMSRNRVGNHFSGISSAPGNAGRTVSEDSTRQPDGDGVLHRVVLAIPPERLAGSRLLSDCPAVIYVGEE